MVRRQKSVRTDPCYQPNGTQGEIRMLLSTSTEVLQKFYGYEETIRKLAAVGFDAFDFTMAGMSDEILKDGDYVKKAESLRALADSLDIRCNQTHSPFPVHKNGHPEWDKAVFDAIVRCLEISHTVTAEGGNSSASEDSSENSSGNSDSGSSSGGSATVGCGNCNGGMASAMGILAVGIAAALLIFKRKSVK